MRRSSLTVTDSPCRPQRWRRAIKGAISFDNLNGSSAGARLNNKRILYASETAARAVGGQITLHAYDAGKMAAGMPIRYLGIDIGQIQSLELITAKKRSAGESGALSGIRRHLRPRRDPLLGDHPANLRRGRGTSRHPVPGLHQR